MKVLESIKKTTKKRPMHFSLIDPDPKKNGISEAGETAARLSSMGTDAIMVGGSTGVNAKFLDMFVLAIKKNFKGPVILFPGGMQGLTRHADALFFMSLLNSRNPFWITRIQEKAALHVKRMGIETIPMAYIIIEPGMKVGKVGEADLIKRYENDRAAGYAAAAELLGFSVVYLEAGSGATSPVTPKMVSSVKRRIGIPLIVGGGITNPGQAKQATKAGADIIVTGTIIEDDVEMVRNIIKAVKEFRK